MPAKDSKTILVRVPAEIVEAAQKLKEEENLPTIGNAIRYWFEQQKDEEIQLQLADIKVRLEKIAKIQENLPEIVQTLNVGLCRLYQTVFTLDSPIARQWRKLANCGEFDNPGCLRHIANSRKRLT